MCDEPGLPASHWLLGRSPLQLCNRIHIAVQRRSWLSPAHCCFSTSSEFPFTKLFGFLDEKHGNTRFIFTGKIAYSFSLESEELG